MGISGHAFDPATGAAKALVPVTIQVTSARGIMRTLDATSDAEGNFFTRFRPLPGETGRFTVAADYPSEYNRSTQDSFVLLGLGLVSGTPSLALLPNQSSSVDIVIENLADVALTGLTVQVEGAPDFLHFNPVLPDSLSPNGKATVSLIAIADSAIQASGQVTLMITSAEGATLMVPISFRITPLTARLATNPGYLSAGMLRGNQTLVSFEIINTGGAATGPLWLELPQSDWLSAASSPDIASIDPDGRTVINLWLTPGNDLPLTIYEGELAVRGNNTGLIVPFQFRAVSEAVGDLVLHMEDEFTYFAEGKPPLSGVSVILTDALSGDVVGLTVTGEDGTARFFGVAEGSYMVAALAERHAGVNASIAIRPGETSEQTLFLSRQAVSYRWSVVPIETTDRYRIVLETVFETEVPMPVVTVDQPYVLPLLAPGETSQFNITLRNHGLIDALNVRVMAPDDPDLIITPAIDMIPVLAAKSEITIPVSVRLRDGFVSASSDLTSADASSTELTPEGLLRTITTKCLGMNIDYTYNCSIANTVTVPVSLGFFIDLTDTLFELRNLAKRWDELVQIPEIGTRVQTYISVSEMPPETDDVLIMVKRIEILKLVIREIEIDFPPAFFYKAIELFNDARIFVNDLPFGPEDDGESACSKVWHTALTDGLIGAGIGGLVGGLPGAGIGFAKAVMDDLLGCLCSTLSKYEPTLPPEEPPKIGELKDGPDNFGPRIRLQPVKSTTPLIVCTPASSTADEVGSLVLLAGDSVCAQVQLRLEQEVVLTRTAFLASLEFNNGLGQAIEGMELLLDIRDLNGNSANDKFIVRGPDQENLSRGPDGWTVAAYSTGTLRYTLVPRVDAATNGATRYSIGGHLIYRDNGASVDLPLLSTRITVYTESILDLNYFWQRDVYGDDPFTDLIELSEPFALGLQVTNIGRGDARNVAITTAQPKIIENETGLLIDFNIASAQVQDKSAANSLTITLGGIAVGNTKTAQWNLVSSLQGKFVEYEASFEQLDNFGGVRTSLINSVNIHELIRSVQVSSPTSDGIPDFLVNDLPDPDNLPDRLYLSTGGQAQVSIATNAALSGAGVIRSLTADMFEDWSYLKLADPLPGYALVSVVRSDGKTISLDGMAWRTDRSFRPNDTGATYESLLHLLDYNSTGSYTLNYAIVDDTAPSITAIEDRSSILQTAAVNTVYISFSEAVDLTSFNAADIILTRNGEVEAIPEPTLNWVSGTTYILAGLAGVTGGDSNYMLSFTGAGITDLAGNPGTNAITTQWAKGASAPVIVVLESPSPKSRNSAVSTLDVSFSRAMNASSIDVADLTLTRNGFSVALDGSVTVTAISDTLFRIAGLQVFTRLEGVYTLTMNSEGTEDTNAIAGVGQLSTSWRTDTTAPDFR